MGKGKAMELCSGLRNQHQQQPPPSRRKTNKSTAPAAFQGAPRVFGSKFPQRCRPIEAPEEFLTSSSRKREARQSSEGGEQRPKLFEDHDDAVSEGPDQSLEPVMAVAFLRRSALAGWNTPVGVGATRGPCHDSYYASYPKGLLSSELNDTSDSPLTTANHDQTYLSPPTSSTHSPPTSCSTYSPPDSSSSPKRQCRAPVNQQPTAQPPIDDLPWLHIDQLKLNQLYQQPPGRHPEANPPRLCYTIPLDQRQWLYQCDPTAVADREAFPGTNQIYPNPSSLPSPPRSEHEKTNTIPSPLSFTTLDLGPEAQHNGPASLWEVSLNAIYGERVTHKIQEIITEGNNEESQTICNHETSPSGLLGTPKSLSPTGSHDGHLHSHNALPDALHLSEFMDVDEEYFHESEATCSYTDVESFTPGEDTSERSKNQSFIDPEEGENADAGKKQACLRCRFQKQKCLIDPDDPAGECIPCRSFNKDSKKTIHRSPCFRKKIGDVVLFRKGGLGLTRRWSTTQMRNIGSRSSDNSDIRTITYTLGACDEPITIKVTPFIPENGDVTARYWTVTNKQTGIEYRKSKELEPYCLVDIYDTAAYFERYVRDNALSAFLTHGTPSMSFDTEEENDVIQQTYMMALHHYLGMKNEVKIDKDSTPTLNREKRLLGELFTLWFATRHTTGSAYMCGDDTLDMEPEVEDKTYPLHGKVSLPRMLLAQFDSINYTRLLSPHGKNVLRELEFLISQNQKSLWFTLYIALFILLREASWISKDRYRHARDAYGARVRYSIPDFVEELQESCNMILMHWHYYNCHPFPHPDDVEGQKDSMLSELTPDQYELVMETMHHAEVQKQLKFWQVYKEDNGTLIKVENPEEYDQFQEYTGPQTQIDWDHPYYWVAQLFEKDWTPHPTYQREAIPISCPVEKETPSPVTTWPVTKPTDCRSPSLGSTSSGSPNSGSKSSGSPSSWSSSSGSGSSASPTESPSHYDYVMMEIDD